MDEQEYLSSLKNQIIEQKEEIRQLLETIDLSDIDETGLILSLSKLRQTKFLLQRLQKPTSP